MDLARWNAQHGKYLNRFLVALRRLSEDLAYDRAVEVQDGARRQDGDGRGALHDHLLLASLSALDVSTLRRLAIDAGYGHSVDLVVVKSIRATAIYLSKYVTKAADERPSVPWAVEVEEVDRETGETRTVTRRLATYRTWAQSENWGPTIKALRAVEAAQLQAERSGVDAVRQDGVPHPEQDGARPTSQGWAPP